LANGRVQPIIWTSTNGTHFPSRIKSQIDRLQVPVKLFTWNNEIKDTPYSMLIDGKKNSRHIWSSRFGNTLRSNWFRLLLLYKYGGVWFDVDVMFLRPIQEIIATYGEFVTDWGHEPYTNTCVMHFVRRGRLITILLQQSAATGISTASRGLTALRKATLLPGITVISNMATEFCWLIRNCAWLFVFEDPSPRNMRWIEMLKECIVWHWHNHYDISISKRSIWAELERQDNEKL
jgi:hypothetical protein